MVSLIAFAYTLAIFITGTQDAEDISAETDEEMENHLGV
jgi:hypothetical protein